MWSPTPCARTNTRQGWGPGGLIHSKLSTREENGEEERQHRARALLRRRTGNVFWGGDASHWHGPCIWSGLRSVNRHGYKQPKATSQLKTPISHNIAGNFAVPPCE